MSWQLSGTYFENCNCDVTCPCAVSGFSVPGDNERCIVLLAFHVDSGKIDDVDVSGLSYAVLADAPGAMAEGTGASGCSWTRPRRRSRPKRSLRSPRASAVAHRLPSTPSSASCSAWRRWRRVQGRRSAALGAHRRPCRRRDRALRARGCVGAHAAHGRPPPGELDADRCARDRSKVRRLDRARRRRQVWARGAVFVEWLHTTHGRRSSSRCSAPRSSPGS